MSYEGSAGRTTVALELCRNAVSDGYNQIYLADFDIQKPDMIKMAEEESLKTIKIFAPLPVIDISHCRYCGICASYCAENAIRFNRYVPSVSMVVADCISCGNCLKACTRNGIRMLEKLSGSIVEGKISGIPFIAGQINQTCQFENPLIKALIDRIKNEPLVICDFAPGNDNVVSRSIQQMDIALIVVEPGVDWENKLSLMLNMVKKAQIAPVVLVNKVQDGNTIVEDIKAYCAMHVIPLPGIIPLITDYNTKEGNHSAELDSRFFSDAWKTLSEMISVHT